MRPWCQDEQVVGAKHLHERLQRLVLNGCLCVLKSLLGGWVGGGGGMWNWDSKRV